MKEMLKNFGVGSIAILGAVLISVIAIVILIYLFSLFLRFLFIPVLVIWLIAVLIVATTKLGADVRKDFFKAGAKK